MTTAELLTTLTDAQIGALHVAHRFGLVRQPTAIVWTPTECDAIQFSMGDVESLVGLDLMQWTRVDEYGPRAARTTLEGAQLVGASQY